MAKRRRVRALAGFVVVQLHPVSSLGLVASDTSSLQGRPDEQPS
jgi:hypothetical protein